MSSQANAVVQSVIDTCRHRSEDGEGGCSLDLSRHRRDQQQGNGAGSRQAVEQADAERLPRGPHVPVAMLGLVTVMEVAVGLGATGAQVRVLPGPEVPAEPT